MIANYSMYILTPLSIRRHTCNSRRKYFKKILQTKIKSHLVAVFRIADIISMNKC